MQDVQIRFSEGPLRGQTFDFEVGRVSIGRLPGEGGLELKGADSSVSRNHAELLEKGGDIELRNLSPNGTQVDGKVVLDNIVLEPGAQLKIGENHLFTVQWKTFVASVASFNDDLKPKAVKKKKGPLSSPIVRAMIAFYLLGLVGIGVWVSTRDDGSGVAPDEWPTLQAEYEAYTKEGVSDSDKVSRTQRAEVLVRELRTFQTRHRSSDIEAVCREIMSLDSDTKSPLYQFGARCLGSK